MLKKSSEVLPLVEINILVLTPTPGTLFLGAIFTLRCKIDPTCGKNKITTNTFYAEKMKYENITPLCYKDLEEYQPR